MNRWHPLYFRSFEGKPFIHRMCKEPGGSLSINRVRMHAKPYSHATLLSLMTLYCTDDVHTFALQVVISDLVQIQYMR